MNSYRVDCGDVESGSLGALGRGGERLIGGGHGVYAVPGRCRGWGRPAGSRGRVGGGFVPFLGDDPGGGLGHVGAAAEAPEYSSLDQPRRSCSFPRHGPSRAELCAAGPVPGGAGPGQCVGVSGPHVPDLRRRLWPIGIRPDGVRTDGGSLSCRLEPNDDRCGECLGLSRPDGHVRRSLHGINHHRDLHRLPLDLFFGLYGPGELYDQDLAVGGGAGVGGGDGGAGASVADRLVGRRS